METPAAVCLTLGSIFLILSAENDIFAAQKKEILLLLLLALLRPSSAQCSLSPSSCWFIDNLPLLYGIWQPVTSRPHVRKSHMPQKNKCDLINVQLLPVRINQQSEKGGVAFLCIHACFALFITCHSIGFKNLLRTWQQHKMLFIESRVQKAWTSEGGNRNGKAQKKWWWCELMLYSLD